MAARVDSSTAKITNDVIRVPCAMVVLTVKQVIAAMRTGVATRRATLWFL